MPAPYKRVIHGDWVALEEIILELFRILNVDTTLADILTPPGSDGEIIYNNDGVYGADSSFSLNDVTKMVTVKDLTITTVAASAVDTDKFLVDDSNVVKFRTGAEVLSDIGGSASGHLHDGATLQHDGVNSDGGAFSFTTSGAVTFSQDILTTGATVTNCAVFGSDSALFQPNADAVDFFRIKNAAGTVVPLNIDTINNQVTIGKTSAAYPFLIKSTDGSDQIKIYHTNSHTFIKTSDGDIRLQSDEGTDHDLVVRIMGKGTGIGYYQCLNNGSFGVDQNYIQANCAGTLARILGAGDTITALELQNPANIPVRVFASATEGEHPPFEVCGFGTGSGSKKTFATEVEKGDVANTVFFYGLSNYSYEGNLITLNDTHEDSDGGRETRHDFKGQQSGGEETTLARIEVSHYGAADDEKGKMVFGVNRTSDLDTPTASMHLDPVGMQIYSADATDQIQLYHDNTNPYMRWTDGDLFFQTDEGTNANTIVNIIGKGTGLASLLVYNAGNTGFVQIVPSGAAGYIIPGAAVTHLALGSGANFTKVEADGTLEFNGAATVWNDINIGAGTLSGPPGKQPGIANFVDEVGADTGIATYGLAVGEGLSGALEIPHSYKEVSDIYFLVHWQGIAAPTGTDNVKFQLTYTVGQFETTLNAVTVITVETAFDTQYEIKRSDFAAITGTNFDMENQFLFTIERIAAVGDAYGGEALIGTIGIHFEEDTVGSRTISTK